ncbi:MAG: hypothetical protein MUF82_02770 [Bacteroidetes bacterium]|jgi:hypothetical protein|nr:hypothetical protein [Bacteroidota bacterium]
MNRAQEHLVTLLSIMPVEELPSDKQRTTFERIKERLTAAENVNAELRRLFRVKGFGEAALGMLWVVDQVNRDKEVEDESVFVIARMRKALSSVDGLTSGEPVPPPLPSAPPDSRLFGEPTPAVTIQSIPTEEAQTVPALDAFGLPPVPDASAPEPVSSAPAEPEVPFGQQEGLNVSPEPPPPLPASSGEDAETSASPESVFGRVLERFLEALQVGSDDRLPLLRTLVEKCDVVGGIRDGGEELRQYTALLKEFLVFIEDQQLLDDVRVMNAVSNVEAPYRDWLSASSGDRGGTLGSAIDFLSNAKAMFE